MKDEFRVKRPVFSEKTERWPATARYSVSGIFILIMFVLTPTLLGHLHLNFTYIALVQHSSSDSNFHPSSLSLQPSAFTRDVTRFQLGEAYARAGDMPSAIGQWRAAHAAPYFLQRGLMLRHQQDWIGAEIALRTAIAVAPDDANLQTTLGHFYWEWARPDEARAHLRAALNTETRPYERLVLQGELAHLDGRFADAENLFREALRAQPARPEAYRRLADLLAAQGRPVDAIRVLGDGIGRVPPTLGLYLRLAQLLTQQGHFAEADRWYQQAG